MSMGDVALPPDFQTALIAWLNANPVVTALFPRTSWGSTNVPGASAVEFGMAAPDYVGYPYCVLTQVSEVTGDFDSEGGSDRPTEYQFAVYDDDPDSARATRRTLEVQLDALTSKVTLVFEDGFQMAWWPHGGGFGPEQGGIGMVSDSTVWRAWCSYRAVIGRQRA
jgi:hypothetical protein